MNYLHYEFDADADDVIEVTLDHPANVQLLDPANYGDYQNLNFRKKRGLRSLGKMGVSEARAELPHVRRNG